MLKRNLFLIIVLLFCHQAIADEVPTVNNSKNVLFIGNSLTTANNMPKMVADFAKARGKTMNYEVFAPGGYRFADHYKDPQLIEIIEKGNWDIVVLQEQSQFPAFSKQQVRSDVLYILYQLRNRIKASNPEATLVFYCTMAHKNGDPANIHVSSELGTYEGMQNRLNNTYISIAKNYQGILAPVGQAWQELRKNQPNIELYVDTKHPNLTGSYVVASVLYETIFQDSSAGLPYPEGIPAQNARVIQKTVSRIFGSSDWDFSRPQPEVKQAKKDLNIMEVMLFLNANHLPKGAASYKIDKDKKLRQYFDKDGNLMQESYLNENNEIITKEYDKAGQIISEYTFNNDALAQMQKQSDDYHKNTVVPEVTSVIKSHAQAVENYIKDHEGNYPTRMTELTQPTPPYLAECQCDQNINMYMIKCDLKSDGYKLTAHSLWPQNESYVITTGENLIVKKPGELSKYAKRLPSKSPCR